MKYLKLLSLILVFNNSFGNVKIKGELIGLKNVTEVAVFLPIGNHANSNQQTLVPVFNDKFNIDLNVTSGVFIKIRVQQQIITIAASPGDNIIVQFFDKSDKLKFMGSNAAGEQWYNKYIHLPASKFTWNDQLLAALPTQGGDLIIAGLNQFIKSQTNPLDSLYEAKQIDSNFLLLAKIDIKDLHVWNFIKLIASRQEKLTDAGAKNRYQHILNSLNKLSDPESAINTKTYFGTFYLHYYYENKLNNKKTPNEAAYNLGPYDGYAAAPDSIKNAIIGDILVLQKTFGINEFDFQKAFLQFKKEFPKSDYIKVIESYGQIVSSNGGVFTISTGNIQASDISATKSNIVIDTVKQYNSLEAIKQHFKGKYVYIDLWASWCVPCMMEFPYYKTLNSEFKAKEITSVFVSIDAPAQKSQWENLITLNQLTGYHILANNSLQADIKQLVYKKGQVSIPRYIILNKNGEVIDWDAPRPSNPELMKKLNELL